MASFDSGCFIFKHDTSPHPLTDEETKIVPDIAQEMYASLCRQENQMMFLGDFIDEVHEHDVRSVVVDEVLKYMTHNRWVEMWKARGTAETWISIVVAQDNEGE